MAATGVEALITEALLNRVLVMAALLTPALAVALPDREFPPAGQVKPDTYLATNVLRAETRAVGISKWDEHAGTLQVDVVYKPGAGPIPPTNIADAVAAWFPRNWSQTNGGVRVAVYDPPSVAAAISDEPYKRIPVSIRYRTFTA